MRAAAVSLTCNCFPRRPPDGVPKMVMVCAIAQHGCNSLCSGLRCLSKRTSSTSSSSTGPVVMMARKRRGDGGGEGGGEGELAQGDGRYKDTVDLPVTSFSMKANSAVREPEIQRVWEEKQVWKRVCEGNQGETFTLHDGPPYANGDVHMGHALNKILKDFINRYQLLRGRKVHYVPGWDCHGLPIELKVLQSMDAEARKELTPMKLRKKAAQFALKTVEQQRKSFKRMGVWGDWEHPYLTLSPEYEAAQIGVFGAMAINGHIYRGRKPVYWSPSSGTALAEAELEYSEDHVSRSVYVAMEVQQVGDGFPADLKQLAQQGQLGVAVWTTTPWTLPANAAVAVNGDLHYAVVEVQNWPRCRFLYLVVAADLVGRLEAKWGARLEVKGTMLGKALEHCRYRHPLASSSNQDKDSLLLPVVLGGDYITTESGTGLVHTAPGHGQEDYATGLKYGLPLISPVDGDGKFTEEAGEKLAGLEVLGDGSAEVVKELEELGILLLEEAYKHKYPYDWRSKKPVIVRATEQWFASVDGFRQAAVEAIGEVEWVPQAGERRILSMTQGRGDWCISRQRAWGVPIPVFYHAESGEALLTEETVAHVQGVVAQRGSDAWWYLTSKDLLPERYKEEADLWKPGQDTMDVWFDSGTSWAAVVKARQPQLRFPADLYLEGSDQHRGWFQSSLLTSVAAAGQAPFRRVLTHGFVLDERGRKMSKSLGNVVDPMSLVGELGADVLRLWVASVDYTADVSMGNAVTKQLAGVYRKLRGTMRFLLANLHDFRQADSGVGWSQLPAVDRFALFKLGELLGSARECLDGFQFFRFFQLLQHYVVSDLSNSYLDGAKDRLYTGGTGSFTRRACQTVLAAQLLGLARAMAPLLPHLAEDVWQHLPSGLQQGETESVFLAGWPEPEPAWVALPAAEVGVWASLLRLREEVNKVLEQARDGKLIGANLDAAVYLSVVSSGEADEALLRRLRAMQSEHPDHPDALHRFLLTSHAQIVASPAAAPQDVPYSGNTSSHLWVGVARAPGRKCERCWNYNATVGASGDHPTICSRCVTALASCTNAPSTPLVAAV